MELIEDAKQVLLKAWSVRLALLGAAFSALEVALPFFAPFVPPGTMAILAIFASSGAAIARIVAQPSTLPKS
jgi:uncharacterized membrane protein